MRAKTSTRVKVACFVFRCFLCTQNLFLKKKKNRLEIALITSIYYTSDEYPYQPAYREFICTHLLLFVIICDFLSLYENKQMEEYHHLEHIFYHQNTIMIFCWFCMFPCYVFWLEFFSFFVWLFFLFTPFAVLDSSPYFSWNASFTLIQQTHQLFFLLTWVVI